MNAIDFILIIPLAWAAYKGFKKGFIIEIFSLLALFAGVYGGIHLSEGVASWLDQTVQIKEKYLPVVSFAVTFIAVVVVVFYLGKLIEKTINMAAMKPLNKLAGTLFSILKYGLIMSVILGFLLPINKNLDLIKQSTINESALVKPIEDLATTIIPAVKESNFYKALNGGKINQWKDDIVDDLQN